ncbi:ankyrin repeat-containing domain protein, partial [Diplogelasinospora grovesii]
VNVQGGVWGTALQAASAEGHKEVVEMLLGKGADVSIQGGYYGKGADVSIQGGYYGTALQAATDRGHKKIVEILLDYHVE